MNSTHTTRWTFSNRTKVLSKWWKSDIIRLLFENRDSNPMWNNLRSMRGNTEPYAESCSYKLKLFISLSSSIACFKTTVYILVYLYFSCEMLIWFSFAFVISISIKNNNKSVEHVVSYLKLVLRFLKTVSKNKKFLTLKNCLKLLKWKSFSVMFTWSKKRL